MKIRKLTIENLNSLRLKKTIDFTQPPLGDTGLFAITGDTGAGKTTVLDAITLGIYGRIHRNDKPEEVMSYGSAESLAEVEFETPRGLFRAKWSLRRAYGKLDGALQPSRRELSRWDAAREAFVIVAEKKREVDEMVEEISGLDYDRFTRSVLLSQGDFAAFLKSGERERSELLERITGTEIYSELSQAAYRRGKLEEEKLDALRRTLDALRILDPQTRRRIEAELAECEAEHEKRKTALNQTRESLQWRQRLRELEERQEQLLQRREEIRQALENARPQLERLEKHRKTMPLQAPLARLGDLEDRINQLRKSMDDLQTEIVELTNKSEQSRQAALEAEEASRALQQQLVEQRPLFERVGKLDVKLDEQGKALAQAGEGLAEVRKEVEADRLMLAELEKEQEQKQQQQKQKDAWLKKHAGWQDLQESFLLIEQQREDLRNGLLRQKRTDQEVKEKQALLKKERRALAALEKEQTEQREKVAQLEKAFHKALPEPFPQSRNELLDQINRQMEELAARQQKLQSLLQLNEDYQEVLTGLAHCDETLEHLRHEDVVLSKQLMNSVEQIDQLLLEREKRERLYLREQQIANYTKDRAQLGEDEPCPLCFSTEHPFRTLDIEPFVDKVREDLEKADRRLEKARTEQKDLTNRLQELALGLKQQAEQRSQYWQRSLLLEKRMAEIAPGLDGEEFAQSRSVLLEKRLREARQEMDRKRAARQELADLNRRLQAEEEKRTQVEKKVADKAAMAQRVEDQLQLLHDRSAEEKAAFEAGSRKMTELLNPYGMTFDVETARETLERLKENRDEYLKNRKEGEEGAIRLQEIDREKERLLTAIRSGENKQADRAGGYEKARQTFEALTAERRSLFGDRDPESERSRLEEKALQAASLAEERRAEQQELDRRLLSRKELRQQQQQEREEAENRRAALITELDEKARAGGFAGLEALREARIGEAEEKELLTLDKDLTERELQIRQSLTDTREELQHLREEPPTDETEERLRGREQEEEAALQQLQERRGALRQQLLENQERQQEAEALVEQIENQQAEFNRWARLNELIGSADGKKFRTFAQGLTLRRLTELANRHLALLNGRYLIEKRTDDDLELEIIDTYQADNRRSMHTLSGGESFLVSLALALGLSDLAGRDSQIQSLFIDEGFGSLDDNSLDLAISTLENLQAGGKTIGIISHVKELKERISTQIQVRKKGDGFSEVAIIG